MKSKVLVILIVLGVVFFNTTVKIIFPKDATSGTVIFIITTAPYISEKENIKSFTFYDVSLAYKDLYSVKVEMNLAGKTSITIQAPDCMLRGFFLDVPSDIVLRILNFKTQ